MLVLLLVAQELNAITVNFTTDDKAWCTFKASPVSAVSLPFFSFSHDLQCHRLSCLAIEGAQRFVLARTVVLLCMRLVF